jgi:hypothetical protein
MIAEQSLIARKRLSINASNRFFDTDYDYRAEIPNL